MDKSLILKSGLVRFDPGEAYILSDDALNITLKGWSPRRSARETYCITFENSIGDKKTFSIKQDNCFFTLDSEFLVPGEINGKMFRMIGDVTIQSWDIAPLEIVELDSGVKVIDLITEMRSEITSLKETTKEQSKNIKVLENRITLLEGGRDPLKV